VPRAKRAKPKIIYLRTNVYFFSFKFNFGVSMEFEYLKFQSEWKVCFYLFCVTSSHKWARIRLFFLSVSIPLLNYQNEIRALYKELAWKIRAWWKWNECTAYFPVNKGFVIVGYVGPCRAVFVSLFNSKSWEELIGNSFFCII
jgi:hypothetical protein